MLRPNNVRNLNLKIMVPLFFYRCAKLFSLKTEVQEVLKVIFFYLHANYSGIMANLVFCTLRAMSQFLKKVLK